MSDFFLIILLGVSVGWLAKHIGQPAAVAQVILGLIIGPPLLGWIEPGEALELVGQLGVVLLLGMAGMHLGLGRLSREGWTALWVAALGMLFCLSGGYAYALWWGSPHAEAIYVGVALSATSIGISVQLLLQLGLIDHKIGKIVIAAAVIDDVLALYLLAIAHGMLSKELVPLKLVGSMILAALTLVLIYIMCRWLARKTASRIGDDKYSLRLLAASVVIVAFGWLTEAMGYSQVVGGFFAGLGLGDGMIQVFRNRLVKQMESLVLLLVPFFFVVIGSKAEWEALSDPGMPVLVVGLFVVAMVGKILGGYLAAYRTAGSRLSILIGMSMVPRGEVALVIAGLGYLQGHISHHMLVALILVTIGAAVLSPLLMMSQARSLD